MFCVWWYIFPLYLSAPSKRRIACWNLAVKRTYVWSEILMLFKYLKIPNTELEQKRHLIIHGCQIFTFVMQGIQEGASSVLLNLITGTKETSLKIICFSFTLGKGFIFVKRFKKLRTYGQILLMDYQFLILCLSLKLYLKLSSISQQNSYWIYILSFIVLRTVVFYCYCLVTR